MREDTGGFLDPGLPVSSRTVAARRTAPLWERTAGLCGQRRSPGQRGPGLDAEMDRSAGAARRHRPVAREGEPAEGQHGEHRDDEAGSRAGSRPSTDRDFARVSRRKSNQPVSTIAITGSVGSIVPIALPATLRLSGQVIGGFLASLEHVVTGQQRPVAQIHVQYHEPWDSVGDVTVLGLDERIERPAHPDRSRARL